MLIFGDSDPAKWIEAASYSLATHPDPELAGLIDQVVDKVIAAQQPEMRWRNLRDWHKLYCAGHLIEAAVAHLPGSRLSIASVMDTHQDSAIAHTRQAGEPTR